MTDQRSPNRSEQRRARALQQARGLTYMQALAEVRNSAGEAGGPAVAVVESPRQIPVEYRFLVSLVEDLRRHERGGAAQAVLRNRAADWFPDRSSLQHDVGDLLRLASHGAQHWGVSGLQQIEEDQLADLAYPWLPLHSLEAAQMLEQVVGGWRTTLRSRTVPSPPRLPVRRDRVVETLGQIQLGLRSIHALSGAQDWTPGSLQSAAQAANHLGQALSRGFGAGIITALPRAVDAALRSLRAR